MFEFKSKTSELNERSVFANLVCKLLVEKHKGDLTLSVNELKPIYDAFFDNVRNIYELVDKEIPLFALFELFTRTKESWDFNDEEFEAAKVRTYKSCIDFYCC